MSTINPLTSGLPAPSTSETHCENACATQEPSVRNEAAATPAYGKTPPGKFETTEQAQRREQSRTALGCSSAGTVTLTLEEYERLKTAAAERQQTAAGTPPEKKAEAPANKPPEKPAEKKAEAPPNKGAEKPAEKKPTEKALPPHGASDELSAKPAAGKSYKAERWTPQKPVSLSWIAGEAYKDQKLWPAIWGANQEAGKVGNNGNLIHEGKTYRVPSKEWAEAFMKSYDPAKQNIAEAANAADKALAGKTGKKEQSPEEKSTRNILQNAAKSGKVSDADRDAIIRAIETGDTSKLNPQAAMAMAGILNAISLSALNGQNVDWQAWLGYKPDEVTDEERKRFAAVTNDMSKTLLKLATKVGNEKNPAPNMVSVATAAAGLDDKHVPNILDAIEAGSASKLGAGKLDGFTADQLQAIGDQLLGAAKNQKLDVAKWVGYEPKDGVSADERERFNKLATQLGDALVNVAQGMKTAEASDLPNSTA